MGYGKQPYVIYRHDDTKHPHVHVVTTRVSIETGKRLPAYKEGIRSKAITDQLEKQHGLTVADSRSNQIKTKILGQVDNALSQHKPESIKGLNKALSAMESDIRAKSVKNGTVYFRVNEQGKRQAGTYKSSLFKDTPIAHKNLHKQFQHNFENRQSAKYAVQNSFLPKGKTPLNLWERKLESKGVKPIYHEGEKGIYGISFEYKDHVYKGSTLDRKLSFGNIKDKLIFPNNPENTLKENLMSALSRGEEIVDTNPHTGEYITSNPQFDKQLNSLPYTDAKDAVFDHNIYVEMAVDLNLNQFTKMMAGYEEDLEERAKFWKVHVKQRTRGMRIGW